MRQYITGLLMLLASTSVYSQNIQTATLEWDCISTFTARPGSMVDETTKVVSNSEQIIWYDHTGEAKETFRITDINGLWTNVSTDGSIEFTVSAGEKRGVIRFSRSNGITMIRMVVVVDADTDTQIYQLTVSALKSL